MPGPSGPWGPAGSVGSTSAAPQDPQEVDLGDTRQARRGHVEEDGSTENEALGEEKSSFGSKDMMIEERRRPGSARAGRYQEVRGGEGGEGDGMDTP